MNFYRRLIAAGDGILSIIVDGIDCCTDYRRLITDCPGDSLRVGVTCPAWASDETAGGGARVFAVLQDLNPVHEDMRHAGGKLARLFEGGVVGDCLGIKHDDIGEVALSQAATVLDLQVGGGEGGKPANRLP